MRIPAALLMAGAFALVGCKQGAAGSSKGPARVAPDDSDLGKVAEFYYSPGRRPGPSPTELYPYLAAKSRSLISAEQWAKTITNMEPVDKVEVLRQEERQGATFGLVSVTYPTKIVSTYTWLREDGKWRRLWSGKLGDQAIEAFRRGDFAASRAKTEEWLQLDPFSIRAYSNLRFCIERGAPSSVARDAAHVAANRTGSELFRREIAKMAEEKAAQDRAALDEIIKTVLAINPKDTDAVFLAVSGSGDPLVARTLLKRLAGAPGYETAAANVARKITDPQERLRFIDEAGSATTLKILKVFALGQLGKWDECRAVLKSEGFEAKAAEAIKGETPQYLEVHAGLLGLASLATGDTAASQRWLEMTVAHNPNNEMAKQLAGALKEKDPVKAAQRMVRGSR